MITWQLEDDRARRLVRLLGEVIEYECLADEDLEEVGLYVDELMGLVVERDRYEAAIQPGLTGLA